MSSKLNAAIFIQETIKNSYNENFFRDNLMNIGIVGCGNISETYFECPKIFNNFQSVVALR